MQDCRSQVDLGNKDKKKVYCDNWVVVAPEELTDSFLQLFDPALTTRAKQVNIPTNMGDLSDISGEIAEVF